MHPALVIAGKDLRQRLRDRSALVLGFVAPLLIAGLMALAFSKVTTYHATVGYLDLDHGPAAAGLERTLHSPDLAGVLAVHDYRDRAAADAAIGHHTVQAVIVVPAGFTAAVTGGGAPRPVQVRADVDNALAGQVATAVSQSFVAQVNADRLAVRTALAAGAPPADLARLTASAVEQRLPETPVQQSAADHKLKVISYVAPAMGIFFVMFAVGYTSRGYFVEQAHGTLDRIQAAPVGRTVAVVGKSLATFVYSGASLATMVLGSTLLFGADWGNPAAVALLCLGISVSVVCLTALTIALARTERQAEGLAAVVVFALVLAGGNFVFVSQEPPLLRRLALFTPNGWALRGFTDLGTGARGIGVVGAPLLGIAVFSLVVVALTALVVRSRRQP
ncbi:ABC transporter permease [Streptacidiphilus rugosus]|uniref:ABC transporter permease n=1 Tax=Streptacidiphilus rugosus TaxID=405783 RepID=UPI000561BCD3|nr:ABC transporter permease [Streptacidiphilus rugosus]